jgi:hypothetical protein
VTTATSASAGALPRAPATSSRSIVVGEFELSPFESFVAEIYQRHGRRVVAISRVKYGAAGPRRSAVFEFGEHRAQAVASLIDEVLRAIAARNA